LARSFITPTKPDFLLRGARVYRHDGDTDRPVTTNVLVQEGRISAIGDGIPDKPNLQTVSLDGHLLTPGFVNGHFHSHDVLAKGCFETMSLERWGLIAGPIGSNRSIEEVRLRTTLGAVECVRNGITTVQDFAVIAPLEATYVDAIVEAYESVGVRVILSISLRDKSQLDTILWADELIPVEHQGFIGTKSNDGATQLSFVANQMKRIGDNGGRLIWAVSPSSPQRCSFEFLKQIGAFCHSTNLPVYTHVYESRLQRLFAKVKLSDFNGSEIDYMEAAGLLGPRITVAHGVWPDADEILKLANTGTGVVLNMLSNLKLRGGVAPLAAYRRAGVPLSLGCDNCSCSDVQSMTQVMKLYCLLSGIADPGPERPTAAEAIRLATLGGARAAGREQQFGGIEVGMDADLVAFDLSDPSWQPFNSAARQLVFSETGRSIRHVWVGGRHVVSNGKCTLIDENAIQQSLASMMPDVQRDIANLVAKADEVEGVFRAIQARAFNTPLGYDRYLSK
jgi:5-methylthioadenosine/S-adenosylhomocysteine deaminase